MMPSRLSRLSSDAEMMTEKNASHPRSLGNPARTRAATSLVADVMDIARNLGRRKALAISRRTLDKVYRKVGFLPL